METLKSLEDYDLDLFSMFESTFALKYPDMFENKKLYKTWGRKCNFLIQSLRNIILKKEKDQQIQKVIIALIEFLSEKELKNGLQYLSSFNYDIFANYNKEMLAFRNDISTCIFTFITLHKDDKKALRSVNEKIEEAINMHFEDYTFLKSLFELVQYSLDSTVDIYNEYLIIINNKDILQKIIENKNCVLNTNQKNFILSHKYNLAESSEFLKTLKTINISNDDLCREISISGNNTKKKNKKKKINSKKMKLLMSMKIKKKLNLF